VAKTPEPSEETLLHRQCCPTTLDFVLVATLVPQLGDRLGCL
jgi:hypothetical protein